MSVGRRVTVVHRHEMFASALERAVAVNDFECSCVMTTGLTLPRVLHAVAGLKPDVVLAAVHFGDAGGVRSLCSAGFRVIALIEDDQPQRRGEALSCGAIAIATKTSSLAEVLDSIARAVRREPVSDPGGRAELIEQYESTVGEQRDLVATLSRQERDLLAHLMDGRGVQDVARFRFVSEGTVRSQSRSVLAKLRVSSQLSAVAVARQAGYSSISLYAA